MGKRPSKRSTAARPTMTEDVSVAGLHASMAPLGLQCYAADFLSAAKAAPVPNVPFVPARIYLVCHALELALKAFLSLKGRSLNDLAEGAFSHNLENLHNEAERNGLVTLARLEEQHKFQIRRASNYYCQKVFEYPAVGEALSAMPGNPDFSVLIDAAEVLVAALRDPCLNA